MVAAARSRMPWSDADIALLSDLICDGYTRKAVAAQMGRSINAITAMAKKLGLTVLRGETREIVVALKPEAILRLRESAEPRALTLNSFCRVVLEIAAREPAWLDRLLDDGVITRHDALSLRQSDPRPRALTTARVDHVAGSAVPVASIGGPPAQHFCISLGDPRPELTGRIG
jgi:hypothetical protein